MQLKTLGALMVAGCALCGLGGKASAQDYPNRTVKMLIAFSPAGAIDVLGRHIADKLSTMWGQQVIIKNRPGAGGNIGAAAAAQAAPDGYTLHFGAQTPGTNVTLAPSTAFQPGDQLRADQLVKHRARGVHGGERHAFQIGEGDRRLRQGQSREAELRVGRHRLERASRHRAVQRGHGRQDAARALQPDVAGDADPYPGRTESWFTTAGGSLPHIRAGKLRALAVNGPARSKLLPELPTMIELGILMED